MCTPVYRIQNCNNALDIRVVSPTPGVGLQVGELHEFQNDAGFTGCFQILEVGATDEACSNGGQLPILTPYEDNWTVPNSLKSCECPSIDDCGCPPGFSLNEKGDCVQETSVSAVYSGALINIKNSTPSFAHSKFGLRLWEDVTNYTLPLVADGANFGTWKLYQDNGYGQEVLPDISTVKSFLWGSEDPACYTLTGGRLKVTGISCDLTKNKRDCIEDWGNAQGISGSARDQGFALLNPVSQLAIVNESVASFDFCIDVTEERQYLIGMGGDNEVLFYLDGVLQVYLRAQKDYNKDGIFEGGSSPATNPFNWWHVFPITLSPGQHTLTLQGINYGLEDAIGLEVYDLTVADIKDPVNGNPNPFITNCAAGANDLDPYILFSTRDVIGQDIPDLSAPGQWSCPDGSTPDTCTGVPVCTTVLTAPAIPCCFEIAPCSDPLNTTIIKLAENQPQPQIGNIYTFLGDASIEGECYAVINKLTCPGGELTDITIDVDYQSQDCTVCVPCYELTNCKDASDTQIIKWDPTATPLSESTIYVFDFDTTKCWSVTTLIPPCTGTQYGPSNISEEFTKCEDCLTPCFKIVDCVDGSIVYSDTNLISYVGQVIKWNDGVEDRCGTVSVYICREDPQTVQPITVIDCYTKCDDCLPKPELPVPSFNLKPRIVKPGYNTPACSEEYYSKVKCKLSEALYQHMASRRYGIEFCCELDLQKWEIKNEILDIESIKYPDIDCGDCEST